MSLPSKTSDPFRAFHVGHPCRTTARFTCSSDRSDASDGWAAGHFPFLRSRGKRCLFLVLRTSRSQIHEPGSRLPQDRNLRELCLALRLLGWCCPLGFGLSRTHHRPASSGPSTIISIAGDRVMMHDEVFKRTVFLDVLRSEFRLWRGQSNEVPLDRGAALFVRNER